MLPSIFNDNLFDDFFNDDFMRFPMTLCTASTPGT